MKTISEQLLTINNLLGDSSSYVIKGKTYPLRFDLGSWGWHWNGLEWEINDIESTDPALLAFEDLDGVWIEKV